MPRWPARTTACGAPGRSSKSSNRRSDRRTGWATAGENRGLAVAMAAAVDSVRRPDLPGRRRRRRRSSHRPRARDIVRGKLARSARVEARHARFGAGQRKSIGMIVGVERRQKARYARDSALSRSAFKAASVWPRTRSHSASGKVGFKRISTVRSRIVGRFAFRHRNETYDPSQPQLASIAAPIDSTASAICFRRAR